MDQNTTLNQNVDTLFSNLENFTQNEGVLGKPVVQGDKTFIPVVSVTLGYGSGNASNKGQSGGTSSAQGMGAGMGAGIGGALGLGAKLITEAVIIIDKENVSMIPMGAAGSTTQLMDKIPQILMGMNPNNQQGQGQGQQQGQQQGQGQKSQGQQSQS